MKLKTFSFKAPPDMIPSGVNISEFVRGKITSTPSKSSIQWGSVLLGAVMSSLPLLILWSYNNKHIKGQLKTLRSELDKKLVEPEK